MLYIFGKDEKLIAMLPFGSFFDAIHREVLNGENTFRFTVPANNAETVYIEEGNYVGFKDLDNYWQIFEIKRIVDIHGDGLTRTAFCEHIFYELLDDIVTDKRPSADATSALDGMLHNTRWQLGIVDDLGASNTNAYYISALEAVQKVANAWGGELRWRIIVSNNQITERKVDLLAMRGIDTGKQFAYSKDILSIEREIDTSTIATALYGRGKGVETESGSYGRRLTFADIEDAGKPLGQEWVGDSEALARWGRNGRHRFDVFIDEDETDPIKLLEKTRVELAKRKEPRTTYRLDVVSLEELAGYEHEKVRLGDLVRVIDREFTPELVVSARIIELERDLLAPENTKVVLGSFAPTIVEATINIQRQVREMASKPYNTKWLDGVIDVLQNAIENTQSYVFQTAEEGILILDAPDYGQATQAMKLGGGIFAIANQKDGNGGWDWRTFGTGSGFTADEITTGKLKAELIEIGPSTTFAPGYDPVDNHLYFEYSVDGMNWHTIFNSASDLYMRQKVGDNGTWSEPARIAAVDGVDGYTPVKGVDYFDGVDGQDGVNGTDGISSYLWVRYSQNSNGNPMTTDPTGAIYIGIATTTTSTAPASYASYSWSLIKGTDGVPGESGADGKTSYLHIKYSDDGVNFTGNGGEDVGAYIGTYVDFIQEDSTTFSDYTWNKVKGTPIVWKGDLASPPSNPEENWVYRNINNGYVYIYNGTVWELMVTDGADGIDGAPGVDGMSVYITYHNNPTDSQPATPTGDGTSGGWYTAPSAQANWMSQKVATNAYSGTWGAPILISGGRKFTSQPVPPYDVGDLWIGGSDGQNTLICTTARSSGSFVASDWERMTEPVANMGVDSDCLGLWHFDGSLNSHKGVAVTADANFDTGCFGQAVKVSGEAKENVILDPSFENSNLLANWNYAKQINWNNSEETARLDSAAKYGQSSVRCGLGSGNGAGIAEKNQGKQAHRVNAGEVWQISYDVMSNNPETRHVVCVACYDINGNNVSSSVSVPNWPYSPYYNLWRAGLCGTSWNRKSLELTIPNGVYYVSLAFMVYTGGSFYCWFDGIQFEKSPYPTDFIEGKTLGILKAPISGMSASQGTISLRAKNLSVSANDSVLVDLPKASKALSFDGVDDYVEVADNSVLSFNGELDNSSVACSGIISPPENLFFAKHSLSTTQFFPGIINNVRIWTVARTQQQIQDNMNKELVGNESGLVGYWKLNEGTGTNANDSTVNNNDGTIYGATWVTHGETTDIQVGIANDGKIYLTDNTTIVYGPDKSTLTAWDSISLAWKPERLSLVVNDEEACYIENPGLPASLGTHVFIGTDRNGANAINTLIDELRIDKVYRDVAIRTGWHKTGVPFYTSEDMKQWPGYVKVETEGLKVFDNQEQLRVLLGSWLKDAVRKYGLKIIGGEIYSSLIRTGLESATRYIALEPPNELAVYTQKSASEAVPYEVMRFLTPAYANLGASGFEWSYEDAALGKELYAWINAAPDTKTLTIYSKHGQLMLAAGDGVYCAGDLSINGNLSATGSKPAQQVTENYGLRYLYATEAPEVIYYDRGIAYLENGEAIVYLDPIYLECIEPNTELTPWQIWVECYGENDVYVSEVGEDYFKIKERNNGMSNNKVVWKHEAIRNGYAGIRLMEVVD